MVGISFNMTHVSQAIAISQQAFLKAPREDKSYGRYAARRADVYVVAFNSGLVDSRLDICRELWANGIKADLVRTSYVGIYSSSVCYLQMYDGDLDATAGPEKILDERRKEGLLFVRQILVPKVKY